MRTFDPTMGEPVAVRRRELAQLERARTEGREVLEEEVELARAQLQAAEAAERLAEAKRQRGKIAEVILRLAATDTVEFRTMAAVRELVALGAAHTRTLYTERTDGQLESVIEVAELSVGGYELRAQDSRPATEEELVYARSEDARRHKHGEYVTVRLSRSESAGDRT